MIPGLAPAWRLYLVALPAMRGATMRFLPVLLLFSGCGEAYAQQCRDAISRLNSRPCVKPANYKDAASYCLDSFDDDGKDYSEYISCLKGGYSCDGETLVDTLPSCTELRP
jgi:hypothetical protein